MHATHIEQEFIEVNKELSLVGLGRYVLCLIGNFLFYKTKQAEQSSACLDSESSDVLVKFFFNTCRLTRTLT